MRLMIEVTDRVSEWYCDKFFLPRRGLCVFYSSASPSRALRAAFFLHDSKPHIGRAFPPQSWRAAHRDHDSRPSQVVFLPDRARRVLQLASLASPLSDAAELPRCWTRATPVRPRSRRSGRQARDDIHSPDRMFAGPRNWIQRPENAEMRALSVLAEVGEG